MKSETKRTICLLVAIASVLTIVGTVSYAYFTAAGSVKNQTAEITTGSMSVKFADNDNGVNEQLSFGESVTKKFTIENTGTVDASIRLNWTNLINTYIEGSLTYTLFYSETENGTYTEIISETNVPASEEKSKHVLADVITVPVGKTIYYNLVIKLNYLEDINQNPDINAKFSTTFGAEDVNTRTYRITFNGNGGVTSIESKEVTYFGAYGELPTPTREDYNFLGWYTEPTGGVEVTSSTQVKITSDQTLYAQWKFVPSGKTTLAALKLSSNGVKTNFDLIATTDEGIFEMEDDYGTSYYYRGAVENNYVKFGLNASGQDMYWRIIRINGDGSLRMIYTGTQAYANGTNNSDMFIKTGQAWNTAYGDAKYLGWMYGPAGSTVSTSKEQAQTNTASSNIKTVVDEWYKTNIEDTGYASAVADILFCNDRSTPGKDATGWTEDTGLGYGTNITGYGAFGRFLTGNNSTSVSARTGIQPTFKCPEKNDAFTVSDTEVGNGALTYPVGLITADEIVAAGSGKQGTKNSKYYLYRPSNSYWSFSPSANSYLTIPMVGGGMVFDPASFVIYIESNGNFSYSNASGSYGVAPVINISAEYANTLIGSGTMTDPYRAE